MLSIVIRIEFLLHKHSSKQVGCCFCLCVCCCFAFYFFLFALRMWLDKGYYYYYFYCYTSVFDVLSQYKAIRHLSMSLCTWHICCALNENIRRICGFIWCLILEMLLQLWDIVSSTRLGTLWDYGHFGISSIANFSAWKSFVRYCVRCIQIFISLF